MFVLTVTLPPLPPLDLNGQPLNAKNWNVYESSVLIGQAVPTATTFESSEITETRVYKVAVSLVNAVGEGQKSDEATATLSPPAAGLPPKPGKPSVFITEK